MGLTKKQRKEKKFTYINNKKLCKEYPFLIPRNCWTDKVDKDWNYEYTELDSVPNGWRKLALKLFRDIRHLLVESNYLYKFRIMEIKEKYGQLRIYTNGIPVSVSNKVYDLINKAERDSEYICICCGRAAKMCSFMGWYSPYCKGCMKYVHEHYFDRISKYVKDDYTPKEFKYEDYVVESEEV